MKRSLLLAIGGASLLVIVAHRIDHSPESTHAVRSAPHWTYAGEAGPARWSELCPEWEVARTGREQSPIDLPGDATATADPVRSLRFEYGRSDVRILNNGHTIQVNVEPGSSFHLGDDRYDLLQLHFHSPSEHTVDGEATALEMHLVHKDESGHLAVIGVMFDAGRPNQLLERFWDLLPPEEGPATHHEDVELDLADLVPMERATYRYDGSLTTPPCTEGVQWIVFRERMHASREQIAAFHEIVGDTNRPVQPLHEREVQLVSE